MVENDVQRYTSAKNQKIICFFVALLLSVNPIISFINGVFNLFVSPGFIFDTLFSWMAIAILALKVMLIVGNCIKLDGLFLGLGLVFGVCITYLIFPQNIEARVSIGGQNSTIAMCFISNILVFFFTRYLVDYKMFSRIFRNFSIVVIILSIMNYFINDIGSLAGGYMFFSYSALPSVMFLFFYSIYNRKFLHLVLASIGTIFLFVTGARGNILCFAAATILFVLFNNKSLANKIAWIGFLLLLTFIVMYFFEDIIKFLINTSERWGIESRTLNKLLDGSIADDSLRGEMQSKVIANFNVFGHGLWGEWAFVRNYPHNIFIEFIYQFGWPFGVLLLAVLLVYMFQGLCTKNYELRLLIIVMLSCSFVKLQLTGSYLNKEPVLFAMFALCANAIEQRKRYKNMLKRPVR